MTSDTRTDASTDDQSESLQLAAAGVSIEKTAGTATDDDVLTVAFDIESEREEPVAIRLVEDLPPVAHGHDIGFHPQFDPENWSITGGDRLVYEDVLEPNETRTTVYGIDDLADAAADVVSVRPAVETDVSPRDAGTGSSPQGVAPDEDPTAGGFDYGDDGEPPGVTDSPTGDTPEEPAAGEPVADESAAGEDPPRRSADGRGAPGRGAESRGQPDGPTEDRTAVGDPEARNGLGGGADGRSPEDPPARRPESPTDGGSILDALTEELESRELSEADRRLLREALGLDTPRSLETKVRHLTETVDDLVVYRDALEAFIDDNGGAEDVIRDFEDELAEVRAAVSTHRQEVDDRLDGLGADVESVDARLEDAASEREDAIADLRTRVESLEADLTDLENSLKNELRDLRDDVDHGKRWRSETMSALKGIATLDAARRSDD